MTPSCPILYELSREFGIPIPEHERGDATIARAFKLADWATRYFTPKILRHDSGRQCFPEFAERLEKLKPISDPSTAREALALLHQLSKDVAVFRDGSMAPPCKQAYWLCQAAISFCDGHCLPAAFGATGYFDLAVAYGIPVDGEREKLMELLK